MSLVEKFKQYPLVLWALALYLCSLGFNLKYDIPLALFAMVSMYAISNLEHHITLRQALKKHGAVILFLIATVIVTLASRDMKLSAMVQIQLLPALLIYLSLVLFVETDKQRTFVIVVVVFAALVAELSFMAQALYLSEIPDRLEKMWAIKSPLFVAPNDVLFFAILVPLGVYLAAGTHQKSLRILGGVYVALTFGVSVYMHSRQAVGVCIISLVMMALLWRPMLGLWIAIGSVLMVILLDGLSGNALSAKLVYLFPRRYVWAAAWQMFLDQPLLGHGSGMFRHLYLDFLEKAGYLFEQIEDQRPMNWAHSLYLEQLAEKGLVGLFGLLLMIGCSLTELLKKCKALSLLEKGLLASWACFLIAGIAESSLLRLWVVTALFLLLGLTNLTSKKE